MLSKSEQTQLNNAFAKLVRLHDQLDNLQRRMVISGRSSQFTSPTRRVVQQLAQAIDEMRKVTS
jgi:hypothetical protein